MYIALIADIEESKQLQPAERSSVQEKLQKVVRQLNQRSDSIVAKYRITLGDEFQAIFSKANNLFDDAWNILAELHPVKVRFSVGVGSITTQVNSEEVLAMDGPAFHIARAGIKRMKQEQSLFQIGVEGSDDPELSIINNSLGLLSKQIRGWNANRVRMQHMLRKGMGYKAISRELGISEVAFYKNKEAASLVLVNGLFDDIQKFINARVSVQK